MKNLFLVVFFFISISCGVDENTVPENDTVSETLIIPGNDFAEEDNIESRSDSFLLSLTESDKNLNDSLRLYLKLISAKIENEAQITEAFLIRDKITMKFEEAIFNYLADQETEYDPVLESELNKVGFQGVYVEGMFMLLDIAPVLEKKIEEVASEEFKLRIEFKNAVASSQGSEYPFDSMSDELEVVRIGDIINRDFPNSKLSEEIREDYMTAVSYFTDFHIVIDTGREEDNYIVGGLDIHMYPSGSYRPNFEEFTEKLPNSIFTKIVKRMLDEPSVINSDENEPIYLVVIEILEGYSDTEKKIFEFMQNGIDIPHHIIIREGDENDNAVVYRFYSDFNKAEKALTKIQINFPDAEIISVDISGHIL